MIKPIFPSNIFKNVKVFLAGFLLALAIMVVYSVYARWTALVTAYQYPEVVANLSIEKNFQVKK